MYTRIPGPHVQQAPIWLDHPAAVIGPSHASPFRDARPYLLSGAAPHQTHTVTNSLRFLPRDDGDAARLVATAPSPSFDFWVPSIPTTLTASWAPRAGKAIKVAVPATQSTPESAHIGALPICKATVRKAMTRTIPHTTLYKENHGLMSTLTSSIDSSYGIGFGSWQKHFLSTGTYVATSIEANEMQKQKKKMSRKCTPLISWLQE
mmetsp:Transcript_382/g.952  ORF Transcript_382/g.952 Transcript_382/m.952 type:complete len:206 (+) Transcript_382:89-706(+)